MTLEKAHELTAVHVGPGSGCNRDAARMAPGEVTCNHGHAAVDQFIRDHSLEQQRG